VSDGVIAIGEVSKVDGAGRWNCIGFLLSIGNWSRVVVSEQICILIVELKKHQLSLAMRILDE